MRKPKASPKKFWNKKSKHMLATVVGCAALGVTATSVSFQDIVELTNSRTSFENRWLAHVVSVPNGSNVETAQTGKLPLSDLKKSFVLGVQTVESMQLLSNSHDAGTGEEFAVNRSLKGDRVFTPEKPAENVTASLVPALLNVDTIMTGGVSKKVATNQQLLASAQSFQVPTPHSELKAMDALPMVGDDVTAPSAPINNGRLLLAKAQMDQARSAAREMAKVVEKVKREEIVVAANPATRATVSSYALATEEPVTQMASAFAAVLRPTLQKEAAKSSKNGKAKKAKRSRSGRSLIRLAKGDHKWAANPLPKHSYSRQERRCLASGIYFEARGEPTQGQQAVAQVILNRVRNPAYPKSICGVVYQNKRKRNACQFSFACDGIRDRVNSRKHWNKSVKVANDAIDGKFWLRSVGSSSHYHADYVWPRWRKKMRKMVKIGRHIFYRTYGGGWS